ncbi:MAG: ATP-binding protein [Methylomonas sp.]|jgi:signal transduction histidine kinase
MQIRRVILISFVSLLFLIVLPLMAVLFFISRNSIEQEISRNLNSDAIMLMEEVDMLMFERMQNVHSWSHLDIIQEGRIGDVDKRLSEFLANVESGYKGMYSSLFYVDAGQRAIAASNARVIGKVYSKTAEEVRAEVPNGEVFVEDLQFPPPPYQAVDLVIRAPVNDSYSSGNMGQLYGFFDMQQLFRLLDHASASSTGDRYIVLLDGKGRAIAASANLRKLEILSKTLFADWKPKQRDSVFVHDGQPITEAPVLVGYAASSGYLGYVRMGWSILIFQSTADAFLPIRSLLLMFGFVIVMTMGLAFSASHWISGYIAKPILTLTKWVRDVRSFEKTADPQVGGAVEICELASAFQEMLQALVQSREQVIQTAKLAVIGEMSATMAHEIRTPLGIISTSAQLLQRELGLSPEGKEMSQFILDESARLKKLATTLLECARPREPQLLPTNIHELIAHAVELLASQAEKKQLLIEQQLHAEFPVIPGDEELLTQVLLNLLLNAIQIVPYAGFIQIRTFVSHAEFICIEISDNGPGIAEDDYQHLFEPFFSRREGGIGLGLTVTRQIAHAHKGRLTAAPSVWGGACFTLYLPMTKGITKC